MAKKLTSEQIKQRAQTLVERAKKQEEKELIRAGKYLKKLAKKDFKEVEFESFKLESKRILGIV